MQSVRQRGGRHGEAARADISEKKYLALRGDFTKLPTFPPSLVSDVAACWAVAQAGGEPLWSHAFNDALTGVHWKEWLVLEALQVKDYALLEDCKQRGVPAGDKEVLEVSGRMQVRMTSCLMLLNLCRLYVIWNTQRGMRIHRLFEALNLFDYDERPTLDEREERLAQHAHAAGCAPPPSSPHAHFD
ncbi:hypothetical protein JCM10213v2_006138 [Rhodosporidiobolus nylandii]